jgi:archaellum component FlaC
MNEEMNQAEVFDCTPTWQAVMRIHAMCLTNGIDEEAKIGATEEIVRCGSIVDDLKEKYNNLVTMYNLLESKAQIVVDSHVDDWEHTDKIDELEKQIIENNKE